MGYILHIGTSSTGPDTHVTGITDIAIAHTGAGLRIYSASGRDGGILVRDVNLNVLDEVAYVTTAGLGAEAQLYRATLGGREALLLSGPAQSGISGFWLDDEGLIAGRFYMESARVETMTAMEMVTMGGQDYFFSASRGEAGITAWRLGADDQLHEVRQVSVALQETGNDIFALEHVATGGQNYLMAVSAGGHGIYSFQLSDDGTARLVDSLDMQIGLGVSTPTQLAQLNVGGQQYILVGAVGTSSITVVSVANDGSLRATDQVNDDLNTRFQSISVLETIVVDGRAFVVAGGADDGLSLMTLLPTGRLLHLETIADGLETALSNPEGIELVEQNGSIALYTAGMTDNSLGASAIGRFLIDPNAGGSSGEIIQGGAADDKLTGTQGADQISGGGGDDRLVGGDGVDIIMDGAGSDRMWGGDGADIFVLGSDGENDTIEDFEIGVDRIDMSAMGRFYAVETVEFKSTGSGARISFNGETLILKTTGSVRLYAEDFHYSDLTDLWHISTQELAQGDQQIAGTTGHDMIVGGTGADTISGGAGADTIEGGAGNDMLLGGQVDTVFDPVAATVYRLYQAALDRSPDPVGHRGWIGALTEGQRSLTDVAGAFIQSAEFKKVYGDTSNETFVTLLYNNVLDRGPDAGGLANWTARLESGVSRATLVAGFSESAEFKAGIAGHTVQLSFEGYRAAWVDDVYRLYQATLDRAPDRVGLENWTIRMANGMTIGEAATGFVNSVEFQNTYGALDDGTFVQQLYRNVLDRGADPTGLESWTTELAQGATHGDVVTGFSQSREFVAKSADLLAAWVNGQGMEDVLEGDGGDNVLFGGMWADSFVFDVAAGGTHEVTDLEVWDQLRFEGFGYDSGADIRRYMRTAGEDVVFSDQGVVVRLLDTSFSMLEDDNIFAF
jgi:Ca2+-binding RTX toxin-like protein